MTAIPIAALEVGGSLATAALVAAMLAVGQLGATLPAGWFVTRFGEKAAMLVSTAVTAAGALGTLLASTQPVLGGGVFMMGTGVAVFTMARHAWITAAVPVEIRGRTLSLVAGFNRLGMLVGPFVAAGAFAVTGRVASAFVTVIVTSALVAILVAITRFPVAAPSQDLDPPPRVFRTMWEKRGVLMRLGLVSSIVGAMRHSWRILVPLCGVALGLDKVTIALVIGISSAVDFSLFYVGGVINDRLGRLWVVLPALWTSGLAHLMLAMANLAPGSITWYVSTVMIMSVAHGVSSGVVATMGSDLADPRNPAAFLSSWRLVAELGPSAAPLLIAGITATASLSMACLAMGVVAIGGAATLPRYVRRYLPPSPRRVTAFRPS